MEIEPIITKEEYNAVYDDFCKCANIALKLAMYYPEDPRAWNGTVSERLGYLVDRLLKKDG